MGIMKNLQMKYDERGFGSSDMCVCSNCFSNKIIKEYIMDNGEMGHCDYCDDGEGKESLVLPVDKILEIIMSAIKLKYDRAVDVLSWDGKEGGYLGNTKYPEEVLDEYCEEIGAVHEEIFEEMRSLLCGGELLTDELSDKDSLNLDDSLKRVISMR